VVAFASLTASPCTAAISAFVISAHASLFPNGKASFDTELFCALKSEFTFSAGDEGDGVASATG
jgi:hypothetical protein